MKKKFFEEGNPVNIAVEKYILGYMEEDAGLMQRAVSEMEQQYPSDIVRDLIVDIEFYVEYPEYHQEEC